MPLLGKTQRQHLGDLPPMVADLTLYHFKHYLNALQTLSQKKLCIHRHTM